MAEHEANAQNPLELRLEELRRKLSSLDMFDTEASELAKRLLSLEHALRADTESICNSGKEDVNVSSTLRSSVEVLGSTIREQLRSEDSQSSQLAQAAPDLPSYSHQCHDEALQLLKEEASAALQRAVEEARENKRDASSIADAVAISLWQEVLVCFQVCEMEEQATVKEVVPNESGLVALPGESLQQDCMVTNQVDEIGMKAIDKLRSDLEGALRPDIECRKKNLLATRHLPTKLAQNAAVMRQCVQTLLLENEALISRIAERQKDIDIHRSQLCSLRDAASESSDKLIHLLPQARRALLSTERMPSCWKSTRELSVSTGGRDGQSCSDRSAQAVGGIIAVHNSELVENLSRTIKTVQDDFARKCEATTSKQSTEDSALDVELEQLKEALFTWHHQPAQQCSKKRLGGRTFAEWMRLLSFVEDEELLPS